MYDKICKYAKNNIIFIEGGRSDSDRLHVSIWSEGVSLRGVVSSPYYPPGGLVPDAVKEAAGKAEANVVAIKSRRDGRYILFHVDSNFLEGKVGERNSRRGTKLKIEVNPNRGF